MSAFRDRPPTLAGVLVVVAGVVGVAFAALGGFTGAALAALGLPMLAAGAFRGRRSTATVGGLFVVAGAFVGGASGAPPATVVASVAAAFVAWDVAEHGIGIGEQVGAVARSRQAVVAHAAGSTLVAVGTAIVALLLYTVGPQGRPFSALLLLLVGAVVLAVVLTD